MEPGGDLRLGAGKQMRLDGVGVQVAGPGAVGRVGVRLAQPGGAGPERPVDEQVAGQPRAPVASISARASVAVLTGSPQ
ncbi:putative amidohydrolase [Mycobacterium avium subsp. avium 2285 (R)]|nr:putative amidohydrolase [Mycobacterium avium subsp. avium 2285 (R)]